jgi:glycerol-3-phosphate O-acyltransferase
VLTSEEPPAVIAQALRLGFATRIAHRLGDVVSVPDEQLATLNYLRNNVLHAYALPALVAGVLIGTRETTLERIAEFAANALPFLRAELMLDPSRNEAVLQSRRIVELFVEIGLARDGRDGAVRAADRYSTEHAGLELLARSLRHILRRNYLTFALLNRVGPGRLSRERLEDLMQMLAQRLSLLFEFAPPDFFERATFASYIDTLLETGLIRADSDGKLYLDEPMRIAVRNVERLLPADAVIAIRRVALEHLPPV